MTSATGASPALLRAFALWLLWVLALPACYSAHGGEMAVTNLHEQTASLDFRGRMLFLKDTSGRMDLASARHAFSAGDGTLGASTQVSAGFLSGGALWLHMKLSRHPDAASEWWLELAEHPTQDIRVYLIPAGGSPVELQAGRHVPAEQRDIEWMRHAVLLNLSNAGSYELYIRYASNSSLRVLPVLQSPRTFERNRAQQYLTLGAFFAIMGFALLVGAFRALRFRSPVDGWYALYIGSLECTNLAFSGLLEQFRLITDPALLQFSQTGGAVIAGIAILGFMHALIDWPEKERSLLKLTLRALSVLHLTGWLLCVSAGSSALYAASASLLVLLLVLIASIWAAWRRYANAAWFLAAFSPFMFTALARIAETHGYLNAQGSLYYIWVATSILHAFLLLLAILTREASIQAAKALLEWQVRSLQDDIANQTLFTRMLAHELRTPLAIMDANTQLLLRRTPGTSDHHRLLQAMRDGVLRVSAVLERFIQQDRLTAVSKLTREAVDLDRLIDAVINTVQSSTRAHLIKRRSAGGPIELLCDKSLMEVVLTNLLENAVRYSPEGGAIEVRTVASGSATVTIAVSDEGVGIPEDLRERIFDRYYRTGQVTGAVGAGLGLYLVRQIVALHGGEIRCDSTPGEGSCFTVTLPRR